MKDVAYSVDSRFASDNESKAMQAVHSYMLELIKPRRATPSEDMHKATDAVVSVSIPTGDLRVAIRHRRLSSSARYRDVTFRFSRPSGARTEVQKINEGNADVMVYMWLREDSDVEEYVIVDLKRLVACKLLDGRQSIANSDGTRFIAIKTDELWEYGCILSGLKYPNSPVRFRWTHNKNPR